VGGSGMARGIAVALAVIVVALGLPPGYVGAAEPMTERWSTTFGGPKWDEAYSVQQTSDGGYIVTGYTDSYAEDFRAVWLVRTDARGEEMWERTFGETGWAEGRAVRQTSDGGYILTGFVRVDDQPDVWLVKTDADGNKEWARTFGGPEAEWGFSVEETSDDGYVVAGFTRSEGEGEEDAWLIKTDSRGRQVWGRTFGGPQADYARSVWQTSDGGYIIAGRTSSYGSGGADAWLIKTDADGNEQWSWPFGGPKDDFANAVQQTSDGGYVFAGGTRSAGDGNTDMWLVKTDGNGTLEWGEAFGGSDEEEGCSVQQTPDGGYVMAGYTTSYGAGEEDVWLVKADSRGREQWSRTFGGSRCDIGYAVQWTSDSGYVVAGVTESYGNGSVDMWLLKVGGVVTGGPSVYQWVAVGAMIGVVALGAALLLRRKPLSG